MPRRFGIPPTTAHAQVQKKQTPAASEGTKPLPTPTGQSPFRATPAQLGITDSKPITFYVIGDSGGIMNADPQNYVSSAMQAAATKPPAFVYHVGDLVYFNGDEADYPSQFYEPYAHLNAAIVGIPGNHDGDNSDDTSVASLTGFMTNLCATSATLPAGSEEYNRDTETQPNCYWTLRAEAVTIIGCYSNVPSGGVIEADQAAWLASELSAAPSGVPLIVALHHPPYSADAFHGGSAQMGEVLDTAFETSSRTPDLVISGHVHDYQRFTRTMSNGSTVPYIVIGNSGYHNLHKLAPGAVAGEQLADGVVFEAGDDSNWGFLTMTSDAKTITATYTRVAKDGTATANVDSFTAGG
ncbi:MAG: metallophosphoesterase [Solirubrobacteraceae bacterium]|jgi:calcineurin-like phosphoesterase family protein